MFQSFQPSNVCRNGSREFVRRDGQIQQSREHTELRRNVPNQGIPLQKHFRQLQKPPNVGRDRTSQVIGKQMESL